MVTTAHSPLSQDCSTWRMSLRQYKDRIQQLKQQLPTLASSYKHKEDLLQIDHFDNQFYIQLINIHDLKQSIKGHERMIDLEKNGQAFPAQESTLADHAHLLDDYEVLHQRLDELVSEYERFRKAMA